MVCHPEGDLSLSVSLSAVIVSFFRLSAVIMPMCGKLSMNITIKCSSISWYLSYWWWFIFDAVTTFQSRASQRLFALRLTCCGTQVSLFKFRRESMNWCVVFIAGYWVFRGVINHWMVSSILSGPGGTKKCSCILYICINCHLWNDIFSRLTGLLVSLFHIQPWLASGAAFVCLQLSSALTHQWRWPKRSLGPISAKTLNKRKLTNTCACSEHKEMSQAFAKTKTMMKI